MIKNNKYFFITFFILSILFRVIWPFDMEWKADEKLMFDLAGNAIESKQLPMLGMPSGGGLPNAGFSVWPFVLFRLISSNPVIMMLCVALCNVLAIYIFTICIKKTKDLNQSIYFFGILSFGVSLLPVLFSRKIWAQDLIPLFIAFIWLFYVLRDKPVFLMLLGITSALAGQLHLSGFYYAAGLFVAILWFKRFSIKQWLLAITGFIIGFIPALPWLLSVFKTNESVAGISNLLKFEFWLHAITDPLGINARYSFGKETMEFIKFNINGNFNTYLPAIVALLITILFLAGLIKWLIKNKYKIGFTKSEHGFLMMAFIVIPGVLLTISGIPVRSHYLIGALPFLCILFVSAIGSLNYKYIKFYIALQALFCVLFLSYIHVKQDVGGDYGKTYEEVKSE